MAEETGYIEYEASAEVGPGYQAPPMKSVQEISNLDADDESLVKYKRTLLGETHEDNQEDPRRVIVTQMAIVIDGRPDVEIDLTGDLTKLEEQSIIIKEGSEYRIKIDFKIQHEIVSGLRYHATVSRKGIKVDKQSYMVGSYGPKAEMQSWLSPVEHAPKGMLARGAYKVKSKFLDDDKNVHLEWETTMEIKKDFD